MWKVVEFDWCDDGRVSFMVESPHGKLFIAKTRDGVTFTMLALFDGLPDGVQRVEIKAAVSRYTFTRAYTGGEK